MNLHLARSSRWAFWWDQPLHMCYSKPHASGGSLQCLLPCSSARCQHPACLGLPCPLLCGCHTLYPYVGWGLLYFFSCYSFPFVTSLVCLRGGEHRAFPVFVLPPSTILLFFFFLHFLNHFFPLFKYFVSFYSMTKYLPEIVLMNCSLIHTVEKALYFLFKNNPIPVMATQCWF